MSSHYLTEEHQNTIIKTIITILSNRVDQNLTSQDEKSFLIPTSLYDAITAMDGGMQSLRDEIKRLDTQSHHTQDSIDQMMRLFSCMTLELKNEDVILNDVATKLKLNQQDLLLLKQNVENRQAKLYDGFFIWKISDFQEKRNAACSGCHIFFDSPPFYSSSQGYKMCARVYPNGYGNGQGTHMTLFLVLMKGDFDVCLSWPCNHRVIFIVQDQNKKKGHIIDSFVSDPTSNGCQRPQSELNVVGGIEKFCHLAILEQKNNHYVRDNTVFIQIIVNSSEIPDDLVPYIANLSPALPVHQRRELIQNELDKYQRRS